MEQKNHVRAHSVLAGHFRGAYAERGGAGDAGIRAVFREDHGNLLKALIHAPVGQLFTDAAEEGAHELRHASAKNKNVRLEQVDNISGPNGEEVSRFL